MPLRAAVNMTGRWTVCYDCRMGGVCDPLGPGPTLVDQWTVTQALADLQVFSQDFDPPMGHFSGTIDSATGAFSIPQPQNPFEFLGIAGFSTFTGTFDAILETGGMIAARVCDPLSP